MLEYTFIKAADLGMTQQTLVETMSAEELLYWVACDSLKNKEYRDKIITQLSIEKQSQSTEEEKTKNLVALLNTFTLGT